MHRESNGQCNGKASVMQSPRFSQCREELNTTQRSKGKKRTKHGLENGLKGTLGFRLYLVPGCHTFLFGCWAGPQKMPDRDPQKQRHPWPDSIQRG